MNIAFMRLLLLAGSLLSLHSSSHSQWMEPSSGDSVNVIDTGHSLRIMAGRDSVLEYHYKVVFPPEGVDSIFRRSGFIHPLWSPSGKVLSRIQPPDHYHHYGLWNPWTKVLINGMEFDFWNLYKRQGTVAHRKFLPIAGSDINTGFSAQLDHIVFPDSSARKVVMEEVFQLKFQSGRGWVFDITSQLYPLVDIVLQEYRYGGIGFRATEEWTRDNSKVLTSENRTRLDADGSSARWCMAYGIIGTDSSGMVIYSHPQNFNHPEPLRVWPIDANNGRGDVFINFSPTKNKDWKLEKGNDYTLRYRIYLFSKVPSLFEIEEQWNDFVREKCN